TRIHLQQTMWSVDDALTILRINADPEEPARLRKPAVALIADSQPILRRLIDVLPRPTRASPSGRQEMEEGQTTLHSRLAKRAHQLGCLGAIRAELPEDGMFVDEVT